MAVVEDVGPYEAEVRRLDTLYNRAADQAAKDLITPDLQEARTELREVRERNAKIRRDRRECYKGLPIFTGEDKSDPEHHITLFNDYWDMHDPDIPPRRNLYSFKYERFCRSLRTKARTWYDQDLQDRTAAGTPVDTQDRWTEFLQSFKQQFSGYGTDRPSQNVTWKLLKWNPVKETLDEFVYRIRQLAGLLGKSALDQVDRFKDAMPPNIAQHLVMCDDLSECHLMAKKAYAYESQTGRSTSVAANLPTVA